LAEILLEKGLFMSQAHKFGVFSEQRVTFLYLKVKLKAY